MPTASSLPPSLSPQLLTSVQERELASNLLIQDVFKTDKRIAYNINYGYLLLLDHQLVVVLVGFLDYNQLISSQPRKSGSKEWRGTIYPSTSEVSFANDYALMNFRCKGVADPDLTEGVCFQGFWRWPMLAPRSAVHVRVSWWIGSAPGATASVDDPSPVNATCIVTTGATRQVTTLHQTKVVSNDKPAV